MLTEVAVQNFKLFDDDGVTIHPGTVTVLLGPNGTGKSSLMQSLLLLKQSVGSAALLFQGPYLSLGSFKDVVHMQEEQRRITYRLVASYEASNQKWQGTLLSEGNFVYEAQFSQGQLEYQNGVLQGGRDRVERTYRAGLPIEGSPYIQLTPVFGAA